MLSSSTRFEPADVTVPHKPPTADEDMLRSLQTCFLRATVDSAAAYMLRRDVVEHWLRRVVIGHRPGFRCVVPRKTRHRLRVARDRQEDDRVRWVHDAARIAHDSRSASTIVRSVRIGIPIPLIQILVVHCRVGAQEGERNNM